MLSSSPQCKRRQLFNATVDQTKLCSGMGSHHSGQTHDACAVPAISLQKKLQTSVESFTLTAKLNAISENLSFLRWACVQNKETGIHLFYRWEFGLSGHFVYRFHTNVALVKVCSNFETRKWRWFCVRPLWMGSRLIGEKHLLSECNFLTGVTAIVDGIYSTILAWCPSERAP